MKMDNKSFVLIVLGILVLGGGFAYNKYINREVQLQEIEVKAKIQADAEVEKQKIVQEAKTERTNDRMQLFPWIKDKNEVAE